MVKEPGLHIVADLINCQVDKTKMTDKQALIDFLCNAVVEQQLTVVNHCFHDFGNGSGVTGVVILAESHVSVHTWPERNFVSLDVFVCNHTSNNRDKAEKLFVTIRDFFEPANFKVHYVDRD